MGYILDLTIDMKITVFSTGRYINKTNDFISKNYYASELEFDCCEIVNSMYFVNNGIKIYFNI